MQKTLSWSQVEAPSLDKSESGDPTRNREYKNSCTSDQGDSFEDNENSDFAIQVSVVS